MKTIKLYGREVSLSPGDFKIQSAEIDGVTVYRIWIPGEENESGKVGWSCGYGRFLIDSTGYFSAITDYGNYTYFWGNTGRQSFLQFLTEIHYDYLLCKCSTRDEYYPEETVKRIREDLCRERRHDSISKERAREVWDSLADYNDLATKWDFDQWFVDVGSDWDCDGHSYAHMDFNPQAYWFGKVLFARLKEAIKQHLAQTADAVKAAG